MPVRTADDLRAAAWQALSTVYDPELDEPVTDLGFVGELAVDGDVVRARLRLPTAFCAPNFAYLMVADAYDALCALPEAQRVEVRLDDHFASEEINAGVAAEYGFAETFDGLADDELAELRRQFWRKAQLAAEDRLCRQLRGAGWSVEDLAAARLGDFDDSVELARLRRRRGDRGLPAEPDDPLLIGDDGRALTIEELPAHLRFAQTVRVAIEGNANVCRGLLRTRYGEDGNADANDPVTAAAEAPAAANGIAGGQGKGGQRQ